MGHPEEAASAEADKNAEGTEPTETQQAAAPEDDAPVQDNATVEEPEPTPVEIVPPTEEERLRAQLTEVTGRLREVSKAYKDRDKEMEEFRKRQQAHAVLTAERKTFTVVSAFFDPIQNLKRSIEAGGDDAAAILDGLRMVQSQFNTALMNLGLEEVPGVGSVFDPDCHEALAVMPTTEEDQDGKVLVVHTTGYALRGKTLRPAKVVIGKFTEPAEA